MFCAARGLWIGLKLLVSLVIEVDRTISRIVGSALLHFLALLLFWRVFDGVCYEEKGRVQRTVTKARWEV